MYHTRQFDPKEMVKGRAGRRIEEYTTSSNDLFENMRTVTADGSCDLDRRLAVHYAPSCGDQYKVDGTQPDVVVILEPSRSLLKHTRPKWFAVGSKWA